MFANLIKGSHKIFVLKPNYFSLIFDCMLELQRFCSLILVSL